MAGGDIAAHLNCSLRVDNPVLMLFRVVLRNYGIPPAALLVPEELHFLAQHSRPQRCHAFSHRSGLRCLRICSSQRQLSRPESRSGGAASGAGHQGSLSGLTQGPINHSNDVITFITFYILLLLALTVPYGSTRMAYLEYRTVLNVTTVPPLSSYNLDTTIDNTTTVVSYNPNYTDLPQNQLLQQLPGHEHD